MKQLTGNQVRQMFLDYFKSKGHMIEPGASLIPHNDPTLLWINAGVAALKKYFDGADGGGYKTDVYAGAIQFNPTDPVRDENGNWKERPINDYLNPLALLWETEGENKETALRMFANLAFTPIAGLNIKYTASKKYF